MSSTVEVLIERYRKLTVVELKASLRQVGIKPRGLKKDLVRLLAEKEYQRLVVDCSRFVIPSTRHGRIGERR